MINYIQDWNIWRKYTHHGWFFKILVLFGLARSETFVLHRALSKVSRSAGRVSQTLKYFAEICKNTEDKSDE